MGIGSTTWGTSVNGLSVGTTHPYISRNFTNFMFWMDLAAAVPIK